MNILTYILSCLYFFLPAYFANMTPPLARKANLFNFLDKEIDFGKKFLGQPILGSHKSWRGAILSVGVGFLTVMVQRCLYQFPVVQRISLLDYEEINIFIFGLLISFGTVFGDLLFAFIKRRLELKPGARFLPWDQTNYVIGAALFLTPFFKFFKIEILACSLTICYWWQVWSTLFILTFLLHIIANRIGYRLKLNRAKW